MFNFSKLWGSSGERVRIAPSPTGFLHIGTARTALLNWLVAKKTGGNMILRIEDTDRERSTPEFEASIREGLEWLGITWDEEYRQSERTEIYQQYIKQLMDTGKAFRCSHKQDPNAKPQGPHVCPDRDSNKTEGILRLKNDETTPIAFTDVVRGTVTVHPKELGDISIAIDVDRPLFLLAGVIDDHKMGISLVIRGEDHISNTPKQILIMRALGIAEPKWAHIPLVLGKDRSKLSKRHGALSVLEYRSRGYVADALRNFILLLGWHHEDDAKEILSEKEMVSAFSLERMQKGGAIFDTEKLDWMNRQYITKLPPAELGSILIPFLQDRGLVTSEISNVQDPPAYGGYTPTTTWKLSDGREINLDYLGRAGHIGGQRSHTLAEIAGSIDFFLRTPQVQKDTLLWKGKQAPSDAQNNLKTMREALQHMHSETPTEEETESALMPVAEKIGRGEVLWPLRVALSGKEKSPGPFEIISVLGKEESLKRIENAIATLQQ